MGWQGWVALVAVLLALAALGVGIAVWRSDRSWRRRLAPVVASTRGVRSAEAGTLVAVVANPTKPDLRVVRETLARRCRELGLTEPLWLETSEAEPGGPQTHEALAAGAGRVLAVGGDGTVRQVAGALAGTGVPMGLVPLGTGNLLARNLDLPLSDPVAAVEIALTGAQRSIDVGVLHVDRWADPADDGDARPREHPFLVIAGLGFDAAMVADTDDALKRRVGWLAYFVAGLRHLHGRRARVQVALDEGEPVAAKVRSLLVGNCGRLPGGITLLPDAVVDDGWLDVAAIDTRGGVAGWAQLFGEVVLQGVGVRSELPAKIGRIDHARARVVRVEAPGGHTVQVDGDVVGRVAALSTRVDAGALTVLVGSVPDGPGR